MKALCHLFAPTGSLRAAINLGNPLLARRNGNGQAAGVSVDLAQDLADQLGVPLDCVVVDTAAASVRVLVDGAVDVGFFAIDPARGEHIAFTPPYLLIEGCYLVRDGSPLQANDEVDVAGHQVVVGKGSAYDLYLSRELKHATLLRADSSPAVVPTFLAVTAQVAAGVKQQLEADAQAHAGLRLLPGRFMEIRQAMGVAKARGEAAAAALAAYVTSQKANGFVAQALQHHGVQGATVAPAGDVV
jgi:polar amino acid transport system substrate-binding protein